MERPQTLSPVSFVRNACGLLLALSLTLSAGAAAAGTPYRISPKIPPSNRPAGTTPKRPVQPAFKAPAPEYPDSITAPEVPSGPHVEQTEPGVPGEAVTASDTPQPAAEEPVPVDMPETAPLSEETPADLELRQPVQMADKQSIPAQPIAPGLLEPATPGQSRPFLRFLEPNWNQRFPGPSVARPAPKPESLQPPAEMMAPPASLKPVLPPSVTPSAPGHPVPSPSVTATPGTERTMPQQTPPTEALEPLKPAMPLRPKVNLPPARIPLQDGSSSVPTPAPVQPEAAVPLFSEPTSEMPLRPSSVSAPEPSPKVLAQPYSKTVLPPSASEIRALDHYRRGNELGRAGKSRQAILEYEKALQLEPGMKDAYVGLAAAQASRGKWTESRRISSLALDGSGRFHYHNSPIQAHYNLGVAECALGNRETALEEYQLVRQSGHPNAEQLQRFIDKTCKP